MGNWPSTERTYGTVNSKEFGNEDSKQERLTKSEVTQEDIAAAMSSDKGTQTSDTATLSEIETQTPASATVTEIGTQTTSRTAMSEKGTQTPSTTAVSDKETQSPVTFTDRLTSYGTQEVGSTHAFDHMCDLCDTQEYEAVGFCKQCDQFYCFRCCKIHEHIPALRNHTIVAKRDLTGIKEEHKKLFARQIVPVPMKTIAVELNHVGQWTTNCSVQSIALSSSTKTTVVLDKKGLAAYLKVINPDGRGKSTCLLKEFHTIVLSETKDKHDECFLTLPREQEVQKGSIRMHPFKPVTCFNTSGECWGIAEFDHGFAVSVKVETDYSLPDWQLQYLDAKGNIKKQMYYDKENKPLFSEPKYLASNPTHDTIYVSDCGTHEVIALDVLGDVLFTFSHTDLQNPRALTVDDEDNVYVACGNNVIQIHKSGTKHRVMLQKKKDTLDILSVCFNTVSRTLLIGEDSNIIKTFKVLP